MEMDENGATALKPENSVYFVGKDLTKVTVVVDFEPHQSPTRSQCKIATGGDRNTKVDYL